MVPMGGSTGGVNDVANGYGRWGIEAARGGVRGQDGQRVHLSGMYMGTRRAADGHSKRIMWASAVGMWVHHQRRGLVFVPC